MKGMVPVCALSMFVEQLFSRGSEIVNQMMSGPLGGELERPLSDVFQRKS